MLLDMGLQLLVILLFFLCGQLDKLEGKSNYVL